MQEGLQHFFHQAHSFNHSLCRIPAYFMRQPSPPNRACAHRAHDSPSSPTGNVERADNEIFEFILDRDAGCIALAGAEKLDEFGSRIVGDGGQC
jgi:hypothetical protein